MTNKRYPLAKVSIYVTFEFINGRWKAITWSEPPSYSTYYEVELPVPDDEVDRFLSERRLRSEHGLPDIGKRPEPIALPDGSKTDTISKPGLDGKKPIVE